MNGLDTLKIAERLEEHGFDRKQAEGRAVELQEVIAMAFKDIATKDDLDRLASRLAAENRAAIAESRNTQIIWTIGTVLVLAGLLVAAIRVLA